MRPSRSAANRFYVSHTRHRITLYWLLLLLPTLAVGGGALLLLQREQVRIDEESALARQATRSALSARARLIAENIELFVGDLENGLMTTLREAPASNTQQFLKEWEHTNPLVRSTFEIDIAGRVMRPWADDSHDATRRAVLAWLVTGTPWRPAFSQSKLSDVAEQSRGDVTANVLKTQSARSEINGLANSSPFWKQSAPASERFGWTPWRDASGLHLFGWRQLTSGTVIGVEVKMEAVESRLPEFAPDYVQAGALDSRTLTREHYAVRDGTHSDPASPTAVTVPIAVEFLPGWEVVVTDESYRGTRDSGGFLMISSLIVGLFVLAILSGGSLLLWQARRSEAEAVQKTSFVANVSHEFKTPLTTIRLYAELLEQGRVRDVAQSESYLRTIARETERLARLVNNVLDFSRLEQGRKKFAREPLDVRSELSELLDTHAPRIAEAGLTLYRDFTDTPLNITTDRDAVGQILLNLLDNACKYAPGGGEVRVTLTRRSEGAEIRVADRGPGVPPEHRERIFEKFHRVDNALTAEKTGAGLGLSIARQLARGLGGDLNYQPREGGGVEFVLTLS